MSSTSSATQTSSSSLFSASLTIAPEEKKIAEDSINALTNELADKINKINKLKQKTTFPILIKECNKQLKVLVQRIRDLVNQYNLLQGKEVRHFCYQIVNANDNDKKDETIN